MNFTYTVQIENIESGEVIKTFEVIGKAKANKLADGLKINLHYDFIVIVNEKI